MFFGVASISISELVEKHSLDTLKELLIELGGWPVLEGDYWTDKHFNWDKTIFSFRRFGLEFDSMIDISVGFDLQNSNRRMVQIDQPSLGVSREFLVNGLNNKITKAYFEYMVDIALILGANSSNAVREELNQSLHFEISLANVSSLCYPKQTFITNQLQAFTIARRKTKHNRPLQPHDGCGAAKKISQNILDGLHKSRFRWS